MGLLDVKTNLALLFLMAVVTTSKLHAQSDPLEKIIESQIESQADNELIGEQQSLQEDLTTLLKQKIAINTANAEELKELPFLNDLQIQSLLNYRKRFGKILSISEIYLINGFTKSLADELLPYITFDCPQHSMSIKDHLKNTDQLMFLRTGFVLQQQAGYIDSALAGDKYKCLTKYRINVGELISAGFTMEKDAGETWLNEHASPDFLSGYIGIQSVGKIKKMIVGDYRLHAGQGLVFSSAFACGRTADVMKIKQQQHGIKPYRSSDENSFLRGTATTVQIKKLQITCIYSNKKIDASIQELDSLDPSVKSVSSLLTSGLHTSRSEIINKDALREQLFGSNLHLRYKKINTGVTAYHSSYSAAINPSDEPYNTFAFSGRTNNCAGMYADYTRNDLSLFGEAAISKNKATAIVAGFLANLNASVSFSMLYRNYDKQFQNQYANSFGVNTKTANEKGLFSGINMQISSSLSISSYADIAYFPWLRYGINAPSGDNAYLLLTSFTPSYGKQLYYQIRLRQKQENYYNGEPSYALQSVSLINHRVQYEHPVSKIVSVKGRIEMNQHKKENGEAFYGFLFFQDIHLSSPTEKWICITRYSWFETDTYDERFYTFETDVPYAMSMPVCYGKGYRLSCLIRYKITAFLQAAVKISHTTFTDRSTISSGNAEITGNQRSDISLQLTGRF